jgi:hypothetical protein
MKAFDKLFDTLIDPDNPAEGVSIQLRLKGEMSPMPMSGQLRKHKIDGIYEFATMGIRQAQGQQPQAFPMVMYFDGDSVLSCSPIGEEMKKAMEEPMVKPVRGGLHIPGN